MGWILLGLLRTGLRVATIPRPLPAAAATLLQVLLASLPWLLLAPAIVALAAGTRGAAVHVALAIAMWLMDAAWGWLVLPAAGYPIGLSPGGFLLSRLDQALFLYLSLLGIGLALRHHRRRAQAREHSARLEARLLHARLHVLELRLQPHFLFNTLNAVSELVHRDARAAQSMLESLRTLLACSLDGGKRQAVPLREELALLEHYAAIQRARFAGSLTILAAADPTALEARVPRFLLQPLVENAIRHGTARRSGHGRVSVRARVSDTRLVIEVEDDGAGLGAGSWREGVGLGNARERVRHLYGHDARLTLTPAPERGTIARLDCPLLRERSAAEVTGEAPAKRVVLPADPMPRPAKLAAAVVIAWVAVAFLGALEDAVGSWLVDRPEPLSQLLPPRLVETGAWLALTAPAAAVAVRLAAVRLGWVALIPAHAAAGLGLAYLHLAILTLASSLPADRNIVAVLLVNSILVYAAIAAAAHAWTVGRSAAEGRAEAARLDRELAAARLDLLRWQLRPGLLFGALNRIGELAPGDPEGADELTGRLGELLRLLLHSGAQEEVTLGRELEVLAAYLEVEAALRSEAPALEVMLDGGAADVPLLPLLLQPMAEALGGVRITVAARLRSSRLELEVGRAGGGSPLLPELLAAVRHRLSLAHGESCRLISREDDGAYCLLLIMPVRRPEPLRKVA
jgi:LytS/YehU family sensor histidine kinase